MTATTWGEVTRISDTDGDEVADRYDTLHEQLGLRRGARIRLRFQARSRGQHLGGARPERFL